MLRSLNDLQDYTIQASDGNIGHVKDFYFDDKAWAIRYLIVDTGNWLSGRKILISPVAISKPNWRLRQLPISATKEQVKNSPDIDTERPVSRQHEMQYLEYYNYPFYWTGFGLWGEAPFPNLLREDAAGIESGIETSNRCEGKNCDSDVNTASEPKSDPNLRSCLAVTGYHIEAIDGEIGHVSGFLVDEVTWAIRYMIVETGNWWLGHCVLIEPRWIKDVQWCDAKVSVNLTRQTIKDAPEYDRSVELDGEREIDIHDHREQQDFWKNPAERVDVLSPD